MYGHLSSQIIEHEKDHHILVGNPGPGLGQTQICCKVKLVYVYIIEGLLTTVFFHCLIFLFINKTQTPVCNK
jgi:hypothetical protein